MRRFALALVLVAACGKGDDKPPSPRDKVIAAWKDAGLEPSTFVTAQVQVGSDCASGMVGGLDVLLCVFPNPTAAPGVTTTPGVVATNSGRAPIHSAGASTVTTGRSYTIGW